MQAPLAPPSLAARSARELLVLRLSGSQAAMGRQHGEMVRGVGGFEPILGYYPRMPEILIGDGAGPAAMTVVRPLLDLAARRLEGRRPAAFRARSRSFFEALGAGPSYSRNMMVMDLLQNTVGLAGRVGLLPKVAGRAALPACSTLVTWGAASAGGALRHARNFDFPGAGLWERSPAVVFCTPPSGLRYGFVTTRGADTPGITAFNEAGLCLTAHTCFSTEVRFDGVGVVDLCHQIIRQATCVEEAARIARSRPVASTWNLMVSSARERSAAVLEISGQRVEVLRPPEDEPFFGCTNRYRTRSQQRRQVTPGVAFIDNSDGRLETLRRWAKRGLASGGLEASDLMALLGSHEDPWTPERERATGGVVAQAISVQSVILEPDAERVLVSVGGCPTGKGPYVAVPWAWSDAPESQVVDPNAMELLEPTPVDSKFAHGAPREAYEAYLHAAALEGQGGDHQQISACLEQACVLDPEEPGYRLIAAGLRLKHGDLEAGLEHLERGLDVEWAAFRRGQLDLWAARVADALGRRKQAQAHRTALSAIEHSLGEHLQIAGDRRFRRREFAGLTVNVDFPDLICSPA